MQRMQDEREARRNIASRARKAIAVRLRGYFDLLLSEIPTRFRSLIQTGGEQGQPGQHGKPGRTYTDRP
jgi:hypothetical protein